ncbi:MAG: hypothetical protein QOI24_2256 [Acidobacteriota bacterium]|jgi:flagellar biogenesis protein FliO|nr:hypothetical protein [Acidobacteriota bacterium]
MKPVLTTFASLAVIVALAIALAWLALVRMPGRTFRGTPLARVTDGMSAVVRDLCAP